MAAIDLSIIGKLEEAIETLTFRNEASVKIRKIKREKAFSQSIDIIIKSISYNLYENFKAKPPIQFYGYATLVMQDCTEISIPIVSARQRLYYGFQYEAFRQWRHWIEFYQLYQLHRFNDISLASIMGALEIPYEEKKPQLKQNAWIELPIREVYIKLQDGTQFELEFSQWQPVKFTDPINNVEIDGKSKQDDGDKDSGLPKNGIQPKKNSPTNPFGGNPPASSLENAGINGFDLVDNSLLSSTDPSNNPIPSLDKNCYIEVTWTYLSNGTPFTGTIRKECQCDSKLIVENVEPQSACGFLGSVNKSAWVSIGDSNIKGEQIGNGCTIGAITAVVKPKPMPS